MRKVPDRLIQFVIWAVVIWAVFTGMGILTLIWMGVLRLAGFL